MKGRFVTVEGIEGVGKSTHVAFIADRIRRAGHEVVVTREPGGVPFAECIRELVLAPEWRGIAPRTELLLMFAARSAHLHDLVWPELDRGRWVVCDRFTDATYAYQGAGRLLPASEISLLESLVQGGFQPDLTLLLDASWEVTRSRRERRGVDDRFEQEDREFFERVRQGYLGRAGEHAQRMRLVDAGASLEHVQAAIAVVLDGFMRETGS
jgi:dTMP kinase